MNTTTPSLYDFHVGPGNLKWRKDGITVIGNGYGTGPDQFEFPEGLYVEPITQIMYITDVSANRVVKRYPDGKVEITAGQVN